MGNFRTRAVESFTIAAVVPLLLLTGCQSAGAPGGTDTPPEAFVVPTFEGGLSEVGDGALLEGTLAIESGCLVVELPQDGVYVPVFPSSDTVGTGESGSITVGGTEFVPGKQVAFGGGELQGADLLDHLPAACEDLTLPMFRVHHIGER